MSDFGVIRFSARGDSVDWVVAEADGALRQAPQSGSLEAAAAALGDRPVIVLVPAAEVLLTTVEIPARSPSKIRAALPYALEEELADDIDSLHFAIGAKHASGQIPVAVASRSAMDAWLERLAEADLKPQKIIADNQGLPRIPGTMSVLVDADTTMYNDGDELEFAIPYCKPSDVLVMVGAIGDAAADEAQPAGHLIAFCDPENNEKLSHDWIALRNELQSVDVKVMPHGALPKLAATVAAGHGINLLQGPYGKKTEYANLFRPWRIAAALFLGLIVSSLLLKGASFYQMSRDEAALRAQFSSEYREIRPNDSREVLDPVSTVESLRRSLGQTAAPQVFLPSLRELATALAENDSVDIEAISYRAGVIDLRLTAPDVATLDSIQQAVSASGRFRASIQRTDQVADKIDGRIQIRETGS